MSSTALNIGRSGSSPGTATRLTRSPLSLKGSFTCTSTNTDAVRFCERLHVRQRYLAGDKEAALVWWRMPGIHVEQEIFDVNAEDVCGVLRIRIVGNEVAVHRQTRALAQRHPGAHAFAFTGHVDDLQS